MVTIHVNGQDKTRQISDWKIRPSSQGLELKCFFPSGKSYTRPLSECEITPTEVVEDVLLVKKKGSVFGHVDRVVIYGNKQAVVQYSANAKPYVMNMDNIRLVKKQSSRMGKSSVTSFLWLRPGWKRRRKILREMQSLLTMCCVN